MKILFIISIITFIALAVLTHPNVGVLPVDIVSLTFIPAIFIGILGGRLYG